MRGFARICGVRGLWVVAALWLALPGAVAEDRWTGFDEWVESVMDEWHVPGLGVAVVHDDEVVLLRGYGQRDVEGRKPVTPDTLFAIGSNTKSFTAAVLAMLADEGKLDWDEPVRTYLPEFQLHDPIASTGMTTEDLLCHRSGLPRHDLYWLATKKSREELLAGLQYLAPTEAFRSEFQYQNLMYMTAGVVAERIGGKSWEELVRERFLTPLEMKRANLSVHEMQTDPDFSYGYGTDDEKNVVRVPFRDIDAIGPAGSINASAREMIRYVQFHLNLGTDRGRRLLSEANARRMQTPHLLITGPLAARIQDGPEIGTPSYGLGLMVGSYRGHRHIRHGGGIDGFISAMEWLPDDRIGVVAFSNTSDNGYVPSLVVRNVFDRLLGLDPIDWAERVRKQDAKTEAAIAAAKKSDLADAHRYTRTSHAVGAFAGDYEHPGYGTARVEPDGDGLRLSVVGITLPLAHYHYDVFSVPYGLPAESLESGFSGLKVKFDYDMAGAVESVSIPLEPRLDPIRFARRTEGAVAAAPALENLDTILLGGRVIDPESGLDGVRDLGLRDGEIVAILDPGTEGERERLRAALARDGRAIDADGLVVAPGFIDMHAHGQTPEAHDFQVRDGVTTALELEAGYPRIAAWIDSKRGKSRVNYGASVSHGILRALAMSELAAERPRIESLLAEALVSREPLDVLEKSVAPSYYKELPAADWPALIEQFRRGLDEGGLGLGVAVQYYPAATRAELYEVFEFSAEEHAPIYIHVREMGFGGVQEALSDAAATGAPLHIVHLNSSSLGALPETLEMVHGARANGVDVTSETYPYTAASTNLESAIFDEGWQKMLGGIDYADLQWQDTGERLTEETFRTYREQGGVVIIHMMRDEIVDLAVADPEIIIASDGMPYAPGAHPRTAGTFCRVLGRYVRERGLLDLPTAIRKMSLLPAQRLEGIAPEMADKGRIRVGADADLVVFDADTVIDTATFEDDLTPSSGMVWVLVGGTPVVADGELVEGAFPGRPVLGRFVQ